MKVSSFNNAPLQILQEILQPAKSLISLQEIPKSAKKIKDFRAVIEDDCKKILTNLKRYVIISVKGASVIMKWNDYRRQNRKYVTNGSFAECLGDGFIPIEGYKPTWTLADEDHDGLYSFKKWFLTFYKDPTEIKFVDECFEGDLKHWEQFKNSKLIKPIYENLKSEAEQRLLRDVMSKIMETAMDDNNKSQMVALKYLADRGGKLTSVTRGRPKKADIDKAAREIAEEDKATAADLKRILG